MTQCCRYCCYLCFSAGNGIWCDKQNREISMAVAKAPNRCHDFAMNPIGVFGENETGCRPRVPKKKQCDGQMDLFGEDGGHGR